LEQLGINLGFLVSQAVNFTLLAIILYLLLYKPVLRILKERQDRIARSLADVDAARESAARAQQEYDRLIAEAQRKAQEIIGLAAQSGEKVAAEIRAEAQREAEDIRRKAHQEAAEEKERVLSDVQNQIAGLSVLAAERVLGRAAMDEKLQRQLIDQSMVELGAIQPNRAGASGVKNGAQS
jgi:F-type H+-transporting ATPase subunit b